MATNEESAGILRDEILTEAQRESEGIIARARQYAEDVLATAVADANKARREQIDRARDEAARRKELILATVPMEAGRLRLGRIESLLESVHEEARERLLAHDGFKYQEAVVTLAALAVSHMAGSAFVLKASEGDRTLLGDGLAEEVARRVGKSSLNITVTFDQEITGGGVVVEDADARQVWDNRLFKRLERMWPELRRQIAMEASFVPKTASGGDSQ